MIVIKSIIGLNAYTSSGDRLDVREIKGNPTVNAPIQLTNGVWEVKGNSSDSDCGSGL